MRRKRPFLAQAHLVPLSLAGSAPCLRANNEAVWCRTREVFVPLSHAPGHAQVDFGEALGEIGGVVRKLHYFAMSLPHSDAFFIKAYPAETTEAFCDGHVSAFAFFGGVPLSGGMTRVVRARVR